MIDLGAPASYRSVKKGTPEDEQRRVALVSGGS
jgi:hypothetical protein